MFDRNSKRKRPEHSASQFLPKHESLPDLRQAASRCEGCDLYKTAKQTVFGEGRSDARLMLVGDQPGDFEDRYGKPFEIDAFKKERPQQLQIVFEDEDAQDL
ncbi:unnamed protein product [Sphagnum jensenii]